MIDILLNTATTERRGAVRENGKVKEIFIERPEEERIAGSIYKGRVKDVLPGMQAAFVDIGREKNGFLYRDELVGYKLLEEAYEVKEKRSISEFITEGQEVIVQVTKEEFGQKGARLTENVSLSGKYTVFLPDGGYIGISKKMSTEDVREEWRTRAENMLVDQEGMIIRTICESLTEDIVAEDIRFLREDWERIMKEATSKRPPSLIYQDAGIVERLLRDYPLDQIQKIIVDHFPDVQAIKRLLRFEKKDIEKVVHYRGHENLFSAQGVEKELDKALKPKVWLKNGGFLMIEKTEALTVIDVNTGRFTGKQDLEETIRKTNIEAATEIAAQLRLRDISGLIVIDFIDMKREENKEAVVKILEHELQKDRTKTNVAGMSTLGLVEMTRKKVRKGLEDTLFQACEPCQGTGLIVSDEAMAYRVERLLHEHREMEAEAMVLEVPARVYDWLHYQNQGLKLLAAWQNRYDFTLFLFAASSVKHITIRYTGTIEMAQERLESLKQQSE
ncbi:Rne/Rng family ribonuclease [Salibacterium salarium]|uniref:Rne/Rng family ribonuclease n=1 Tax=Salibacterium salarium TaxID=284579 RepID=A0A428N319_9BACI|nr:Rne/Rng family ribonuclease [Salibacterium salarium]RSL32699.1 Rne/Rng family ribonuclease [Salibacterium salarium]